MLEILICLEKGHVLKPLPINLVNDFAINCNLIFTEQFGYRHAQNPQTDPAL